MERHDPPAVKKLKGLKKESLRDNMSTAELVLNMLAEISTKEISQTERPEGFAENRDVAQRNGAIAGNARKAIERQIGRALITSKSAAELNHVVTAMLETSAKEIEEATIPAETEPDHKNNEKQ